MRTDHSFGMLTLRNFEVQALRLLVSDALPAGQLDALLLEGKLASYEYTGCGYYLSMKHTGLPEKRVVCSLPRVMGHAEGIDCGFLVFIEEGELVFECHSWGQIDVPEGFRDKDVQISQINN